MADAPLALKLQVTEAPRCTIRTSGTSVSVTALLNIFLAPPEQPLILLSSLTMVSPPPRDPLPWGGVSILPSWCGAARGVLLGQGDVASKIHEVQRGGGQS